MCGHRTQQAQVDQSPCATDQRAAHRQQQENPGENVGKKDSRCDTAPRFALEGNQCKCFEHDQHENEIDDAPRRK